MTYLNEKILLLFLLVTVILFTVRALVIKDKDDKSQFRLEDLLLGDDGRASKGAAVLFGAFAMTTWMMVYLALTGKMTEGYFGLYVAAWVAPTLTRLIFNKEPEKTETAQQP